MAELTEKSVGLSQDAVCWVEAETSHRAMKNKTGNVFRLPSLTYKNVGITMQTYVGVAFKCLSV